MPVSSKHINPRILDSTKFLYSVKIKLKWVNRLWIVSKILNGTAKLNLTHVAIKGFFL